MNPADPVTNASFEGILLGGIWQKYYNWRIVVNLELAVKVVDNL